MTAARGRGLAATRRASAGPPPASFALVALLLGLGQVGCGTDSGATRETPPETSPASRAPAPAAPEPEPAGTYYEVKAGDTLWDIARTHGLPVEELVEVNGLERPDQLAVGQLLFIPDEDGLALAPEPRPAAAPRPPRPAPSSGTLAWPIDDGVLLREFAPAAPVPYEGILLAAPRGTEVRAAAAGDVAFVGDEGTTLGRMVIIKHDDELLTIYAHLDGTAVSQGDHVQAGTLLGSVGVSGRVESPQLHFQVRQGRQAVDPLAHLVAP